MSARVGKRHDILKNTKEHTGQQGDRLVGGGHLGGKENLQSYTRAIAKTSSNKSAVKEVATKWTISVDTIKTHLYRQDPLIPQL